MAARVQPGYDRPDTTLRCWPSRRSYSGAAVRIERVLTVRGGGTSGDGSASDDGAAVEAAAASDGRQGAADGGGLGDAGRLGAARA